MNKFDWSKMQELYNTALRHDYGFKFDVDPNGDCNVTIYDAHEEDPIYVTRDYRNIECAIEAAIDFLNKPRA